MGAAFVREGRGRGRSHLRVRCATSRLHKQQPRRGRGQPLPWPKGRARRSSAWGVAWRHRESGLMAPPSVEGRCACRPWAVVPTTVHGTKLRPVLVAFLLLPVFSWPDALDRDKVLIT